MCVFAHSESKAQGIIPDTSGTLPIYAHLDSLYSLPVMNFTDSCWVDLLNNRLNVIHNWPNLPQVTLDSLYDRMKLMIDVVDPAIPSNQ